MDKYIYQMIKIFQAIIATIITIVGAIKNLFSTVQQQKIEKIQEQEVRSEAKKESTEIKQQVKKKDLAKLNDLAGWKE
jgi:Sec-independent protein translocase protein TatA